MSVRVCPRCRSIYATKVQWCGIDNSALVEQPNDPLVGSELERYRIVEPLGVGGMGCVYRASHTFIEREYAIKVLFGDFAGDPKFRERFRREAKSISQIRHPNIVLVEDFGTTTEGLTFLAMEMVHGRTLEKAIEQEAPFSPVRAAMILRQIVAGLGAAHSLGFVHRDVKPSNIMLSQQNGLELVKILDFGAVSMRSVPVDQRLTSVGHIIGTPTYMAPEQSQDPNVGPPADLYAAAVILFEMLTGRPPFVGKGRAEVLIKHIMEEAPKAPPSRGLERVVAALLKKHPEERPQAAIEVIRMIDGLGLDLTIVSDAPRPPQTGIQTAEIPARHLVDFHTQPTRSETPSTDPSHRTSPDHPTPRQDVLGYDTFPVLASSDANDWQNWSNDVAAEMTFEDFESAPTTKRNALSDDPEGEFGGATLPVDGSSLDHDSSATTEPPHFIDSGELHPSITDDIRVTRPVDMRPPVLAVNEPRHPRGSSNPVTIRDDGPTQIDFSLMPALALPRISTDDVPTADIKADPSGESLIPPPLPEYDPNTPAFDGDTYLDVNLDTAKTLSDSDMAMTSDDLPAGLTLRDTPAPAPEPRPAPTLQLPMREDFTEDSEESMSVKARVIPVNDEVLVTRVADRPPYFLMALIALVLAVTVVIAAVVIKHARGEPPIVIIEGSAHSGAVTGQ